MSDGLQMWILLFSKARRERLVLLLSVISEMKRGNYKALVEQERLEQTSLIRDGSLHQFAANWLAYIKTNVAKDYEAAALHLENCLLASSAVNQDTREQLIVEAARLQAFRRHRTDLAREWLNLARHVQSPHARALRFLPEAFVLCHERQFESALTMVKEGVASVHVLRSNNRQMEQQALEAIATAVESHLSENENKAVEIELPIFR